jgi:hypothetical protein
MEIARHWRLKQQRYRLEGSACPNCGRLSFPPRAVCPDCTAQRAPAIGAGPSTFPAGISLADIQAHLSQHFAERLTG